MTMTPARTCSRSTSGISGASWNPRRRRFRSRRCARPDTGWSLPVARRLGLRSMRARLAAAISIVTIAALGGSFFALHERAGSRLLGRIDSNLKEQFAEWQQRAAPGITSTRQLEHAARSFVSSQAYHPESPIFLIEIAGGRSVTNEPQVIAGEVHHERGEGDRSGARQPPGPAQR